MLDFIGMVITAALILLVVNALTTFMDVSRVAKMTLAALMRSLNRTFRHGGSSGWLRELLGSHSAEVVVLMPLMLL